MARPEKNKVDYFPHPSRHGKKMAYIRKKYGNDGYATWFIILEQLGDSDRHYLDLSDEIGLMYLETACDVDQDVLFSIITDLVKLGEFDQELWDNHQVLFSEKFINSISDAYLKRSNKPPSRNQILQLLKVSVPVNQVNSNKNSIRNEFPNLKGGDNTQIKEKEIKENYIKKKESDLSENPDVFSSDRSNDFSGKIESSMNLRAMVEINDFNQESATNDLDSNEAVTVEMEPWPTFEDFWMAYDKKRGDKDKIQAKWEKLKQPDKEAIMEYIPRYIEANPDKQYRKDPATFLNNKSWKDEIISRNNQNQSGIQPTSNQGTFSRIYQRIASGS